MIDTPIVIRLSGSGLPDNLAISSSSISMRCVSSVLLSWSGASEGLSDTTPRLFEFLVSITEDTPGLTFPAGASLCEDAGTTDTSRAKTANRTFIIQS